MSGRQRRVDVREDSQQADVRTVVSHRSFRPSEARLVLVAAIFTVLISAAVCVAGMLAPAPAVAVPLIVGICVGCPMFATWEVPVAVAALRADHAWTRELAKLRHNLEQLPETEHPLGL